MARKRKLQEREGLASEQRSFGTGDCLEWDRTTPGAKDPSDAKTALDEMRLALKDDARLCARRDTVFLLPFLRFTKFDVEAALAKTRMYYRRRSSCPKVLKDLKASEEIKSQARGLVAALPGKDTRGRPVLLLKLGAWDPSSLPQFRVQRAVNLWLEQLTRDPATQDAGICFILDFGGWSFSKIRACEIGLARKAIRLLQDGLPLEITRAHVLRQPRTFSIFFSLLKPFMSKDELARFHLHGEDFGNLHAEVPKDILPKEYGGTAVFDFEGLWERLRGQDS
ncbi:alpha-tocopherol transfer protein-like [Dermacentor silvarum]|uniref:alpha-tocopherol transfer protein-like n=1 Tax=Dermacentor silvarum TaxID=543639 RepID=UPI002101339C|nr:alpha-tocopherol transfer protein-like [Dermacentor silvarum]